MTDKANQARDKLKALNAQLLKKRDTTSKGGTATGILSALRESQANVETTSAPGDAASGEGGEQTESKRPTLTREESTLSILRRSSVGDAQQNPTAPVPSFHVSPPTSPTGAGASLLDVIQAGSILKKEKERAPPPATTPNTIFLSTSQQIKTMSSIKRNREEKLEAMEKLKANLAAKRKQVEAEKKAKVEAERALAMAVAGSVIMGPALQQGSRMVGMPVFVADGPRRMGKSRIQREQPPPKMERKDSKAAELREKQEKIRMAAKEKTLIRKNKMLDKEQKQIHVDNQLNTLLSSLLKLESAYREQERERAEKNKEIADLMNEKNEVAFVLDGTREGMKKMAEGMKDMLDNFPFDKDSEFFIQLQLQQRAMEEMASADFNKLSLSGNFSPRTSATTAPSAPPPPTAPEAPAPPPPNAPSAPSAPSAPAPPPTVSMAPATNFLAGIRGGVASLKKVDPKDLEKSKVNPLGGIFESLHDTLTAAMEVRKLALGDSDDEDEWEEGSDEEY